MSRKSADVVVVGGGSTGSSIAWQLAQKGAGNVVLLERSGLASGATRWSSAQIRQHYTIELLSRMALRALEFFEQFEDRVGSPIDFNQCGLMVLVPSEDAKVLELNVRMQQALGIDSHILSPAEVAEVDSRIWTEDISVAAWEPRSGYCDPIEVTNAYADAARRFGSELCEQTRVDRLVVDGSRVVGVETADGVVSTNTVVVANGYRSIETLSPLGIDLPLTPIRHNVCVVNHVSAFGAQHPIVSDRIAGSYYRPSGSYGTLIGTTAADDGYEDHDVEAECKPTSADLAELTRRFEARFPAQLRSSVIDSYTGVYDCTPDLQPILGPVAGIDGVHLATGFSGHGFKLAPIVADMLSDFVLDEPHPEFDIDVFSLSRFQEGRSIASDHAYSVGTLG